MLVISALPQDVAPLADVPLYASPKKPKAGFLCGALTMRVTATLLQDVALLVAVPA